MGLHRIQIRLYHFRPQPVPQLLQTPDLGLPPGGNGIYPGSIIECYIRRILFVSCLERAPDELIDSVLS